MGRSKVEISELADAVMQELDHYADASSLKVKSAVRKTARGVRNEIRSNAPVRTGGYAGSWAVKTEHETAYSLSLVVHSKNKYQLAHLLENGHVKRGGGRTRAFPHIAPAEQNGIRQLQEEIERSLSNG